MINRTILSKRLALDGQEVMGSTNGQEGVRMVESDPTFDCILMDVQYVFHALSLVPYTDALSSECLS